MTLVPTHDPDAARLCCRHPNAKEGSPGCQAAPMRLGELPGVFGLA